MDQPDEAGWADAETVASLRRDYLQKHVRQFMPDDSERGRPPGAWMQLVGVAYNRRIYGLEIQTNEEQDDRFISKFNRKPNRSHF